ncbi:hypothetical protein CVU75_00580 [Candidatus Dependentiae bacterium HGW-Dependentiae-1]|nr:MAG: hypothetical protein CVU75_00580 [Candidatus Dependentiae bacterium HGW-Dependentiae-1]
MKKLLTKICALSLLFFSLHIYSTRALPKNNHIRYLPEVTSQTNACITKIKIQLKKEGYIAGEIHLIHDNLSHIGRIQYLRVEPHLRDHGLGKTLMRKALRTLNAFCCEKITLSACPLGTDDESQKDDLKKLITFYTQFGFTSIDTPNDLDNHYSKHMEKIVNIPQVIAIGETT